MEKKKILALAYETRETDLLTPGSEGCRELEKRFPECEFRFRIRGEHTMEDMLWANAVTGHPPVEQIKSSPNIEWLHLQSAGVDGYGDKSIYPNPRIVVTRAADVFSVAIAEHTVGMMLALCRLFPRYVRQQAERSWKRGDERQEIYGSNVLMAGTGSLASEIVKRLGSFGCRIIGVRRDASKPAEGYDKVYPSDGLREALKISDFIINTLPVTPATVGYFGREEFAAVKRDAIYISVGRGKTTDTEALVSALKSGKLYAAGLDVTDPEPLDGDSPLWGMGNVIITPHSSGFSLATDKRRLDIFSGLIRKYLAGETLDYQIDFSAGY